jgi:chorismate mutase/prephenate dehydratase
MKIGYQGIEGAYSQIASKQFFKDPGCEFIGFENFEEIFLGVYEGILDYGVVPIENSLAGTIHKNIDLLNKFDLRIVGEVYLKINHNLLGIKGSKLEDIKEVYSHWQALAQCEDNIRKILPQVKIREYFDTAGSAKYISLEMDKSKAAIASSLTAEKYGLEVLNGEFEDNKNNFTRFVIINKNYRELLEENKKYKTSIIFSGNSVPGFLYNVLKSFADRDINLTKIESRPIPEDIWNYFFYIDFVGKFDDENCAHALEEVKKYTTNFKILGSYISEH